MIPKDLVYYEKLVVLNLDANNNFKEHTFSKNTWDVAMDVYDL